MTFDLGSVGIHIGRAASGNVKTLCPQCSHLRRKSRDRCLSVNVSEQTWLCHHCGWAGGARQFQKQGRQFWSAPTPKVYRKPDYKPSYDAPGDKLIEWFAKRGIPADVIRQHHIETREVWMPGGDDKKERAICFPYLRNGEVVNVKYRTADKRFRMEKDAELTLYGLDDLDPSLPLIWVEGETDKLSLVTAGYRNCVSVPNGAPALNTRLHEHQFDYLLGAQPLLEQVKRHIIAVDADAPGVRLGDELIRRLGPERCARVVWPEGCKDANDVLVKQGAATIQDAVENARLVPVAGVFEVADIADRIYDLYQYGLPQGEHPGWESLAKHYRPALGEWTVWTGIPNHGKTAALDATMVNLAISAGWRFAVCSPESQPLEKHAARLLSIYAGRPFGHGQHTRMAPPVLEAALEWLHQHFVFLLPDEDNFDLDTVLDLARVTVFRKGIQGLVIDPWNEVEAYQPNGLTETQYISRALKTLRQFTRRHRVHTWIVVHPKMLRRGVDGAYPVPTLYDLNGSAHFRNKADAGVVIWRDLENPTAPTQFHVQKIRNQPEHGEPGMVELYFDRVTKRYSEHIGLYALPSDGHLDLEWEEESA